MKYLSRVALMVLSLLVCSIAQATDVLFDVTSTYAGAYTSYCGQTCNVTLQNKTFSAYEWDGAVFPFTASQDVLNATFGEGKWDLQEFDSYDGTTIKMKAATSIVADQPYAIRVKQTVENPTFSGVTFASSISTDFIIVPLSNDLQFWGSYFKIQGWQVVGKSQPVTALSFKSDGTGLGNYLTQTFKTADDASSWNYYGTFAWFYHPTLGTTTPSLSLDIVNSGGGGGGDEPAPTTLAGKIAARAQITDAPTIYIDLPGIGNQALGEYLYKIVGSNTVAEEAPYRPAKIQVVATSDTSSPHYLESFIEDAIDANGNTNVEIKVRGNSTALESTPTGKRPYRLRFAKKSNSTDGKAHKHDLLGYGYSKRNWTLLANVNDNSLLRNAVTYQIGKAVGLPFCPGYKFVDLVINNEYRGTYQVSDHCEVDANRININEDTGWYVEFQGRNTMCDYPMCFSEGGMNMNISNPEPADENDETQRNAIINPIKDWFLNTWKKAFGAGYTNPETGWRAYNDEESLIKFWIATELTGDFDGLMSVKAYREANGKLCWGPLWDKDLAFGNWRDVANPRTNLVLFYEKESSVRDDLQKLTKDPEFMIRAKETLDNLISSGIKATLLSKIDEMAEVVAQTAVLNFERWGNPQQPGAFGHVNNLANHQAYVDQLKEWLSDRIDYVQERFTSLAEAANTVAEFEYDVTNSNLDLSSNMDKLMNVTIKNRSFTANGWNAIALPFNVNETQLKSVFGNNFELKEFTGVSNDGKNIIFQSPADNAIIAGRPYLIKPSQAVSNPVFNNVMLTYAPPGWSNNVYYGGESVTYGNYTFTGHITNAYLYKSVKIVGADGTLQDFSSQSTLNGSMAYITIANNAETPVISFEAPEEPVTRAQMNDVPTIYIDSDAPIDADNWGTAAIELFDQNNMIGGYKTWDNTAVSVKYVGDGSDIKTSYRLKFEKKYALLGSKSGSYKQWVLESNDDDPTMLRNGLTEELGDQLGFGFTPGCQYADLVVNGTYVGTYQITDRVKVESGRVLVSDKDADWLLEIASNGEVGANDLYVASDGTNPNIVIKNPDKDEITAEEQAALQTAVGTYFASFWTDVENKVDQTSFINWYVASEILGGYKQLSDIFVYKDNADGKLFFGPLWSNDKAYGNNTKHPVDMSDLSTAGSYNGMLFNHADYQVMCNKIEALWQQQWFKDAVIAKWNTIYGESKTKDLLALLTAKIDVLAAEIAQTQADNYASKANGGAGWELEGEYSIAVQAIKDYLTERFVYLDTKFKELSANESVETVELIDGQPYTNTADQTVEKVTYTRTFGNTKWQAWFAPFDLNVEDYLNDFSFAKIHHINLVNDGTYTTGDQIEILYTNADTGILYANKPYLIKAKSKGDKIFELSNVTLKSATDITTTETSTTSAIYTITGTYEDVTATSESPFMAMGGGTINWITSATLHSYRWYIKVTPKGNYAKPEVFFAEYDPDATGIRTTKAGNEPESYFSPNGIQLEKPVKGLNIIKMKDGTTRKIIVK